jgi:Tfp pilus assembly protein PilX
MLRWAIRRGERGSVALAVIIIVLLAGLAAVMVSRNSADGRTTRARQDRAAALAAADAGLAETVSQAAMARDKELSVTGDVVSATWTSTATRIAPERWAVTVVGRSHGQRRTITATLVQRGGSGWLVSDWHEGPGAR